MKRSLKPLERPSLRRKKKRRLKFLRKEAQKQLRKKRPKLVNLKLKKRKIINQEMLIVKEMLMKVKKNIKVQEVKLPLKKRIKCKKRKKKYLSLLLKSQLPPKIKSRPLNVPRVTVKTTGIYILKEIEGIILQ